MRWLQAKSDKTGEKRYIILLRAVLLALLPFLCCVVTCAVQGKSIGQVYLPSSEWNDELFYYKQVEGMIKYGYPQGYFGFNESHALRLSYAAWSPVLVFPWIIWGLIFGWNMMSPIICNIFLMTLAVFLFMCLAKPTWKQSGILALCFCLYTIFVRYMLSGMPEVICFSLLIIFYGIAVNYLERERLYKLALLFVISGVLTLMRPYMLLFMFLPIFLSIRKYRLKGMAAAGGITAVVLVCYALIKHYLAAEYFAPLFFTDWITTFFAEGFGAGVHNFFGTLYWMGKGFIADMVQGFRTGLASGAFFGGYMVMMLVLIGQSVRDGFRLYGMRKSVAEADGEAPKSIADNEKKSRSWIEIKNGLTIEAHLAVCFVGMLFALLLMYKLTEGSKHLLTFMAVGVFVVSMMETRTYKKAVLIGATFAYLFSYKATEPYDYQIPFAEEALEEQVENWREIFEENIEKSEDTVPGYENTIIWTFNDEKAGEVINTKWQLLYALPTGMGISCCENQYVVENLDTLQSRYIALPAGGSIDEMCRSAGYEEIGRDEDMAVYARY
jgi:hypothetical protein